VPAADLSAGMSADGGFDDLLTLSTRTDGDGTVTVTAVGEVDDTTAPRFSSVLESQVQRRPPELVIDLSGIRFLASAGLTVLVAVHRSAHDHDVALRLVARTRAVTGALRVTGLIDLFTVTSDPGSSRSNR
jgi:anti-sigma B factor antagonist